MYSRTISFIAGLLVLFTCSAIFHVTAQVPSGGTAAGPARKKYDEKLGQWKQMLKDLQQLRTEYDLAKPSEITAIRKRWDEAMATGDVLFPELRDAALGAFAEAPNKDRQITRLLVELAGRSLLSDDYEVAEKISVSMLKSGSAERKLYDIAGISCFATHKFTDAEQYFKKAEQLGVLSQMGNNYYSEVKKGYAKYWEQEEAIRAAEATTNLPRVLLTTSAGVLEVELFENEAPETVGNFINLIEQGFYDGIPFHRVLENFMAQTGCPQGDGTGGPGYKIYCECLTRNDFRRFFTGSLGMAHAGPNTGGSQFFITFRPTGNLNGLHTAFGRVVKGMDVLLKLARVNPDKPDAKIKPDTITKVEVIRKRNHDYVPRRVAN